MSGTFELQALPPVEAIEYFRQKGYAISFDYRDVWREQHQASFTVAKVLQEDILRDIRQAVDDALANGIPYTQFAKGLTPTLQEKGWWGLREIRDPVTGEVQEVQLGSPRRLKTIYDTNLRTAHAEGQWQRIQDNKEAFPYLEYDGNNSASPRADHSFWDGLTLPVDHPFWQDHMPPKEYGCKCRARPRTARQVERSGKPVGPAPDVPLMPYVNTRTGEVQQVPAGVHPSFHYAPGGRRASLSQLLVDKLEAAPADQARTSVAALVGGQSFSTWYTKPAGVFPLAQLAQATARSMGARSQLLVMSSDTLAVQLREFPQITQDDYAQVQAVLDHGQSIINRGDGSGLYALEVEGGQVDVLRVARSGNALHLVSLQRVDHAQAGQVPELQPLLQDR
jgi:hypothetical protein